MDKARFGLGMVAKSAMIWLTAGLLFASLFGAVLSASSNSQSRISFHDTDPIVAAHHGKPAG